MDFAFRTTLFRLLLESGDPVQELKETIPLVKPLRVPLSRGTATPSVSVRSIPREEVFVTVSDIQLNQDPTDEDSWTFNIGSPNSVFYQAFDNSGNNAANETPGLVDLRPHLANLGFEDNGILSIDLENIMELKTNDEQPDDSVDTDGLSNTYSNIVTLVKEGPYSGIFDTGDNSDQSTIRILNDAPRGQSGIIEYNEDPISNKILPSFPTASTLGELGSFTTRYVSIVSLFKLRSASLRVKVTGWPNLYDPESKDTKPELVTMSDFAEVVVTTPTASKSE